MKRSEGTLIRLYGDILTYASHQAKDFGIPDHEILDIVGNAYLRAQRKVLRTSFRTNRESLLRTIAWSESLRELNRRNRRQERILREAVRLDAPNDSEELEDGQDEITLADAIILSDYGSAARKTADFDEPGDPSGDPDWLVGFRRAYATTKNMPRRVLDKFRRLGNWRLVRKRSSLSKADFYHIRKKLRMRFTPCFKAYCAWLARKEA